LVINLGIELEEAKRLELPLKVEQYHIELKKPG